MEPITYVLFGATGDLAQKKIMPALCALFTTGTISEGSQIIAFSRRDWSDDDYRNFITPSLSVFDQSAVENFLQQVVYVKGTFDESDSYKAIKEKITHKKVFFHLAVQPEFYLAVVSGLGEGGMNGKLLIEKPFGQNEYSARVLEAHIETYFREEDIFRIDHYLGKGGLQHMLAERYGSAFELALHDKEIKSIEVCITESIDIAERGEFFDAVGALRDVGQNHLLSMLATLLMNIDDAKKDVQRARSQAIASLENVHNIVRAQYDGYLTTFGVTSNSDTETYVSFEATSTLSPWINVPIYFITAKALAEKQSTITVVFVNGTMRVFDMEIPKKPDAYERIISAALEQNPLFFQSFDEVIASWEFIDPIRAQFSSLPLLSYIKGSTGPAVAPPIA